MAAFLFFFRLTSIRSPVFTIDLPRFFFAPRLTSGNNTRGIQYSGFRYNQSEKNENKTYHFVVSHSPQKPCAEHGQFYALDFVGTNFHRLQDIFDRELLILGYLRCLTNKTIGDARLRRNMLHELPPYDNTIDVRHYSVRGGNGHHLSFAYFLFQIVCIFYLN
ncbi:hypothetical protein MKW98_011721 [Papaver atlanticum]|uniref:Uncharacterized protein n=1 Tax=Papaver atlanticum TaxID=357466 RepID=A0AAD4XAN3_9MAGN|nr:hypothetical protein MKW98_011721 [Papaver atlanticum]